MAQLLRRIRWSVGAASAAVALVALLPPSRASAAEFLAGQSLAPTAGATYQTDYVNGTFSTEFQIAPTQVLPPAGVAGMSFEISAEQTLGQDGTLADDKRVGLGTLTRRDSDPSKWFGTYSTSAFRNPGRTYYFQYVATVVDSPLNKPNICPGAATYVVTCTVASAIFSLRVEQPPPAVTAPPTSTPAQGGPPDLGPSPLLSMTSAVSSARRYARRRWNARTPRVSCRRDPDLATDPVRSRRMARCRVSWRSKGRSRARWVEVYRRDSGGNSVYVQTS